MTDDRKSLKFLIPKPSKRSVLIGRIARARVRPIREQGYEGFGDRASFPAPKSMGGRHRGFSRVAGRFFWEFTEPQTSRHLRYRMSSSTCKDNPPLSLQSCPEQIEQWPLERLKPEAK